jgi:hypothetical protein
VEEVAAAAGALLPRSPEGRHLRAMAAWRAAVGDGLSRSTRVSKLDHGLLTVEVLDPAYRDSLQRMERQILARVRDGMGSDAPQRLRLEVTPGFWRPLHRPKARRAGAWSVAEPPAAETAAAPEPAVSCAAPQLQNEDLSSITDPEQRRALLRVANRYLARSAR